MIKTEFSKNLWESNFGNVKIDVMALDATVPATSLLDEILYTKDFHSNSSTAPCSYKPNEGGICGWDGTTATAGQSTILPIAPTTTHIASSRTGASLPSHLSTFLKATGLASLTRPPFPVKRPLSQSFIPDSEKLLLIVPIIFFCGEIATAAGKPKPS